jgi:hypothetical protein
MSQLVHQEICLPRDILSITSKLNAWLFTKSCLMEVVSHLLFLMTIVEKTDNLVIGVTNGGRYSSGIWNCIYYSVRFGNAVRP